MRVWTQADSTALICKQGPLHQQPVAALMHRQLGCRPLAGVLGLFLLLLPQTSARVSQIKLRTDERSLVQIASPFGSVGARAAMSVLLTSGAEDPALCRFSQAGHLDLDITDFSWDQGGEANSKRTHLSLLGFFLTSWEGEAQLEYDVYQASAQADAQLAGC